jgi:hypothetical protein
MTVSIFRPVCAGHETKLEIQTESPATRRQDHAARRQGCGEVAECADQIRKSISDFKKGGTLMTDYSHWPVICSACADCGVGTITLGEWYMVHDHVWEQAWAGRRKSWHSLPGQQVLRIGWLKKRIGRFLVWCDFIDGVPCNDLNDDGIKSDRFLDRLTSDHAMQWARYKAAMADKRARK